MKNSWFGLALAFLAGAGLALVLGSFFSPAPEIRASPADRNMLFYLEVEADGAIPVRMTAREVEFRAIVPCPRIQISNENPDDGCVVVVILSNLNRDVARLDGPVSRQTWRSPTSLSAEVHLRKSSEVVLEVKDAHPDAPARFFVAGDPELNFVVLERFLADARRERPDFVAVLGDLVQERSWYFGYYEWLFAQAEVPVYVAIGNHDLVGDRRSPPFEARKEDFRRVFGPTHYSFEFRGAQYVFLDTGAPYMGKDQLDWLEGALASGPPRRRFVFAHKPFQDPRPGSDHHVEDHLDRERLVKILALYPELVYYCGHVEMYREYESSGIPVRIVGSLVFSGSLADESDGENGYMDVRVGPDALEEERVILEPSGWASTAWYLVTRVGPAYVSDTPELAIGLALLALAAAGAILAAFLARRAKRRARTREEHPTALERHA
ncbi:MAG: metallophosphoesterase [Planctomycetes bacterium]|nr:metallophosphoesterase [Planctomycetota bacterium]